MKSWRNEISKDTRVIWIHCASLGEFEQGRPLIDSLFTKGYAVFVTFFSSSGYSIRSNYKRASMVSYLPIDHSSKSVEFVQILNPSLAVFVKYEFWPNYFFALKNKGIPLIGISVILRESHFVFKPWAKFFQEAIATFEKVFTQNRKTQELLATIGIHQTEVVGDTRFDRVFEVFSKKYRSEEIEKWLDGKPCLVAGSTWPGDYKVLREWYYSQSNLKLILVPHEITNLEIKILDSNFDADLYSELPLKKASKNVLIVDRIGLLSLIYQYAKITYVGGAFEKGLHNTLEPACYGLPVLFGNVSYHNFQEAVDLIDRNAAFAIKNGKELKETINGLLTDDEKYNDACKASSKYILDNRGATAQIESYIEDCLKNKHGAA
ncbi:MAG: 3-deoxy-D-manno-octulosonic acid transferase [Leadbetterella sp.]